MQKIRYEADPHNRLVAKTGRKTKLPYFRKVLDGRFKIGKGNTLVYNVKAPVPEGVGIPRQIRLKGKWWSLSPIFDQF